MRTLPDRLILLLLSGLLFCFSDLSGTKMTIALLCAVSFCALAVFFSGRKYSPVLDFIFLAVAYVFPPLQLFLSLAVYDLYCSHRFILYIPGGLLCVIYLAKLGTPFIFLLCLLSLLAIYLAVRTDRITKLSAGLLQAKDNRRELEFLMEENRKSQSAQQDNEIRLATLRERNRIAREIHDNVGHLLSRSILMVGALKAVRIKELTAMDGSVPDVDVMSNSLQELKDTLSGAMDSVRSSVHDLHDEAIDLRQSISDLIQSYTFCPVLLDYDMSLHIDREVKYCFLSIIKEALSNTARHSTATEMTITVREHPSLYQLLIRDNGISYSAQIPDSCGIGLLNMKDRVHSLNGTIHFSNENGFRIFITVPKRKEPTKGGSYESGNH